MTAAQRDILLRLGRAIESLTEQLRLELCPETCWIELWHLCRTRERLARSVTLRCARSTVNGRRR